MMFNTYLAAFALDILSTLDMIEMATCALREGYDAMEFKILAGENENTIIRFEADKLIRKAMAQSGMELPPEKEAIKTVIQFWAGAIVSGDVSPRKGVHQIYHKLYINIVQRIPDGHFVGSCIGAPRFISLYWEYDDVQEMNEIAYRDKIISREEALRILNELTLEEARLWI